MATERKKLQKRKEREDKAKTAKLHRAKQAAVKRQSEKADRELLEMKKKIMREEAVLKEKAAAIYDKLPEDVRATLEHNIKILKALEAEHDKEQKEKAKLNENLEEQGADTLDQKLSLLTKAANAANAIGAVGGSAEYSFKTNVAEPISEEIPEQY